MGAGPGSRGPQRAGEGRPAPSRALWLRRGQAEPGGKLVRGAALPRPPPAALPPVRACRREGHPRPPGPAGSAPRTAWLPLGRPAVPAAGCAQPSSQAGPAGLRRPGPDPELPAPPGPRGFGRALRGACGRALPGALAPPRPSGSPGAPSGFCTRLGPGSQAPGGLVCRLRLKEPRRQSERSPGQAQGGCCPRFAGVGDPEGVPLAVGRELGAPVGPGSGGPGSRASFPGCVLLPTNAGGFYGFSE